MGRWLLAALVAVVIVGAGREVLTARDESLLVATTTVPAPVPAPVLVAAEVPVPGVPGASGLPAVDPAWVRRMAARAGIPETALAAYARASLRAPRGCGLGWTTLAGIGWVESQHGTLDGRVLQLDGTSSVPIVGPALDGAGDVRAIPSTDLGRSLHGDPLWDHAVGPMQFITSIWQQWGADGDGDEIVDPQDVDDAAGAAARYLCADGRDLTSGAGWSAGIFSYNRSQVYLDAVHSAAVAYAERTAH